MNLFKRVTVLVGLVFTLNIPVSGPVPAQTISNANDGTVLKQIIIFGRHSIRSSVTDPSELQTYAVDGYPDFGVPQGYLTPRGRLAEALLGAYYRSYLLNQGLLTGNDKKDAAHSYFRSNSIERSYETASAFQGSLIPNATESVHSFPFSTPDAVFDPILAGVAKVDPYRAQNEAQAIFNSGSALASAYSGEYSLLRSVLFDNQPAPPDKTDPTAEEITLTAATVTPNDTMPLYTGGIIKIGGLQSVINAADPFVMQYADGLDLAWGRLTLDQLSQQTRIVGLQFDIEMRSPYLNKVQSSNAASHVLRTMLQAIYGLSFPGAFGDAKSRAVVVISSDGYVSGLAGLLQMHWQLPGYQPDFCAPGGALVFELRQVKRSKKYIVRVFYTAQTLDQLRYLTPLTLDHPPATIQLLVPDGSNSATSPDVDFGTFQKLMKNAIGNEYVENPAKEIQPGVLVLTGAPLK
jgi:4-phytase / acid phosphatase